MFPQQIPVVSAWSRVNRRLVGLCLYSGFASTLLGSALICITSLNNRAQYALYQSHNLQSLSNSLLANSSTDSASAVLYSYRKDLAGHAEHDHWIDGYYIANKDEIVVISSQRGLVGQKLARALPASNNDHRQRLLQLLDCISAGEEHDMHHRHGMENKCFSHYNQGFSLLNNVSYLALPLNVRSSDLGLPDKEYILITAFDRRFFLADLPFILARSFLIAASASFIFLLTVYFLFRLRVLSVLKAASEEDYLTSLANRSAFTDSCLKQLSLSEAAGRSCVLAIIDIDHFKAVNDTYGHQCGDYVLSEVGRLLAYTMRPSDVIGRLGGEEFAILIDCYRADAERVLERVRLQVEVAKYVFEGRSISVSISAGAAETDLFGYNFDYLYAQADKALYRAKADGRNCVRWALKIARREGWDPGQAWGDSFGLDQT